MDFHTEIADSCRHANACAGIVLTLHQRLLGVCNLTLDNAQAQEQVWLQPSSTSS